jgi:hypothetical protein
METQEVLDKIDMKRVKDWDRLKKRIAVSKIIASKSADEDFRIIYTAAMSYIEGCMAEMENEE